MKKRQIIRRILILISFLLFPITIFYFSPYLPVVGSFEGVIPGSMIIFFIMFISSLFFGRLFCGWICPGAGLQESIKDIKNKPISQKYNYIKFLIWMPWILLVAFAAFQAGWYKKIDIFYHTINGFSVAAPWGYIVYIPIICLILIPSLVIGNRSFCHHICWMAPFMIIGRKISNALRIPRLNLSLNEKTCNNCQICNKNCPMSLDVNSMVNEKKMENSECILCGSCVDNCPNKLIKYRFN